MSTNYSLLSLSLSLHLPSSSSLLLALSSSPSTDNPLLLSRHFSLFLPDSVVVEARSHALLLASCSVRSLCRCRGLFAAFGEQWRGREGRGGGWREGWMATMDGWMDGWVDGWMDGWVDGLEGRTSLPKATFLISVKFPQRWAQLADLILTWTADQGRDEWMEGNRNKHYSKT